MATAQDYNAVSQGLDSITRAVLGNYMARRAKEQEAAAQVAREQERADRLAAEVYMRQARDRQFKLAEDQAKATADYRAGEAARRDRADTQKSQAAADAAARTGAFTNLLTGGEAAPQETSQFEHLNPTGEAMPLTPENILKAGAQTGTITPQQLAEIALRNQVATAKAAPEAAKNIEPVLKDYDVGNGQKLKVLYNPATGAHTLVKDPVQNKVAIRDVLAVRSALQKNTARMQELLSVPPENFGLPERREYKSLQEDNTFLNNLIGPVIDGEGVSPGQPAPKADFDYVPGKGLLRPGGNAPTPPDTREEDASVTAPPVAVQPPKPAISPAPQPALRGLAPDPVTPPAAAPAGRSRTTEQTRQIAESMAKSLREGIALLNAPPVNQRGGQTLSAARRNELKADLIKRALELQQLAPDLAREFLE